jgi:hypothetical protein
VGVEAASGAFDLAHVEEVVEGTLDLEGRGMGGTGVEGGDVYGIADGGNELQEMLGQETGVECVGSVLDEVLSLQVVGSQDGETSEVAVIEQ